MNSITPQELKDLILADEEFALIDVREEGAFSDTHLLFAVCMPLSRLELLIGDLVPILTTRLVLVSESAADDLATRAGERLNELGYSNVWLLDNGVAGWRSAGLELFSGVNVPSKAFGEFVEHTYQTPRFSAEEVSQMLEEGRDMIIVDSRPFEEYHRMNIPGATDMPGAELAYRIHDIAPDPETFVLVNCAGRTRSIIGTQSLINAGIPNQVAALKDGTMGWHLAGFELEHGSTREAAAPGKVGLKKARAAATRVAVRFGVQSVSRETVEQWRKDRGRTTYLLDVRSPSEYLAGHLPGCRNAPGGQLVQATDEYVAVKNARLVLIDDVGVRATMTASWLVQMGWRDVHVLEDGIGSGPLVSGPWEPRLLEDYDVASVTPDALAALLEQHRPETAIIDFGPSTAFEKQHIPGAFWCVRARLQDAIAALPNAISRIVLTSPNGLLARVALQEARALADGPGRTVDVQALQGGTDSWFAEGRPAASGLAQAVGATDDVWFKPYEHRGAQEKFMRDYLTWEVALVEQIERDGTTRFQAF